MKIKNHKTLQMTRMYFSNGFTDKALYVILFVQVTYNVFFGKSKLQLNIKTIYCLNYSHTSAGMPYTSFCVSSKKKNDFVQTRKKACQNIKLLFAILLSVIVFCGFMFVVQGMMLTLLPQHFNRNSLIKIHCTRKRRQSANININLVQYLEILGLYFQKDFLPANFTFHKLHFISSTEDYKVA